MKNLQSKSTNYSEIYKLIERNEYINIIGNNEIYRNNINKTDLLHELGNTIYKLVSACWLYDRYNKKNIDLYKIECVISLYKSGIKDEMYNAWLKDYIDSGKIMSCFDKNLYANNIYVLIGIIYVNYGFCYIYNQISEFVENKYTKFFEKISDDDLSSIEYNENEISRAKSLAEMISIDGFIGSYEELCRATSFNSPKNTVNDNFLTYLGINVYELFAFEYIIEHYEDIDLNTLKNLKSILIDAMQINYKLPGNIYRYLNKDNNAIEKDSRSRFLINGTVIFKPYYNVTAIKNIVAVLFHDYVLHDTVYLFRRCKDIFKKFANTEMNICNNNMNYKIFLYYFCKINDFDYKEEMVNKNTSIVRKRKKSQRVIIKSNHSDESIEQKGKSNSKIYKNLFRALYKNVNVSLLQDEMLAYIDTSLSINKVKNNPLEIFRDNKVNFNSSDHVLYIMKKTSNCINRNHKVRSVTGILKNLRGREVKLNVNYCENCRKFSINYMNFDSYCKKYGIMLGNFSFKYMNFDKNQDKKYRLAKESILHFCGYNVNKQKDLTENERHLILMNIMDHGIMKKPEIMEYLHFYINNIGNRSNMELAVSKWEDDLYFVNNYKLDRQSRYKIDKIRHG